MHLIAHYRIEASFFSSSVQFPCPLTLCFCHWKYSFHKPPVGAAVGLPTLISLQEFWELRVGTAARTCCHPTCLGWLHHTHTHTHTDTQTHTYTHKHAKQSTEALWEHFVWKKAFSPYQVTSDNNPTKQAQPSSFILCIYSRIQCWASSISAGRQGWNKDRWWEEEGNRRLAGM